MRAAVWHTPGEPMTIEEIGLRPLRHGDVLVRVTAANVCNTDVFALQSEQWTERAPKPLIMGHGGAGVVEAVGSAVERIAVGDRVIMTANPHCHTCTFCLLDRPDQCLATVEVGPAHQYADGGSRTGDVLPFVSIGAYAEYSVVPEQQVTALSADVSDGAIALLADGLGAGLGAALITAPVRRGATVAVLGCGATGLGYVQGARVAGAERIIAIDPLAHRRELALAVGATEALDPTDGDIVETVRAMTDDAGGPDHTRGVEYSFEASGDAKAIEHAWAMTRPTGHVTLASVPWDFETATVTLPAFALSMLGKTIHSSQYGWIHIFRDLPRFARLIERGDVDDLGRASRDYGLADINAAMQQVGAHEVVGAMIRP